jgi:hypothetical protein
MDELRVVCSHTACLAENPEGDDSQQPHPFILQTSHPGDAASNKLPNGHMMRI